jgi:hypothetical protein
MGKFLKIFVTLWIVSSMEILSFAQIGSDGTLKASRQNEVCKFLAPSSAFAISETPIGELLQEITKKYYGGFLTLILAAISVNFFINENSDVEFIVKIITNVTIGSFMYIFSDFIAQKINAMRITQFSLARTLTIIPIAIFSRFVKFFWLSFGIELSNDFIRSFFGLPVFFDPLIKTLLQHLIYASILHVLMLTIKNFLSSWIQESKEGTLIFNSSWGDIGKEFKKKMRNFFIPKEKNFLEFLFTPFGLLLSADILFSGTVFLIMFALVPSNMVFIFSSIVSMFLNIVITYLMHVSEYSKSVQLLSHLAAIQAEQEMKKQEFLQTFQTEVKDAAKKVKLREFLIHLFMRCPIPANFFGSSAQYNAALETIENAINNDKDYLRAA